MALETKNVTVVAAEYTLLGTNVTALTAYTFNGQPFRIHVIATGGTKPAAATLEFVMVDGNESGSFAFAGSAADIYGRSQRDADTDIRVIRE